MYFESFIGIVIDHRSVAAAKRLFHANRGVLWLNDECKIGDTKAELHGFITDKHGLQ
jgi:hypothetical protein